MNHFYHIIKFFLSVCLFFLILFNLKAQDPHFSQFYSAPVQMNPALTGVFSGEYRFVANYRTQNYAVLGNQSYKTMAASFEFRRSVGRDDYYSIGLAAHKDEVGAANFSRNRAVISAAYLKNLGGGRYRSSDQFLIGGAQLGMGQWSYDWGNLWFNEQFSLNASSAYVDYSASTGEEMTLLRSSTDIFMDFNAGLLYYNVLDDNNSFYIGGAMHHLNNPKIFFIENNSASLNRRWLAQTGGEVGITREVSLLPAVSVMSQGASFFGIGGVSIRYNNHDWREIAIRAGLWGRLSNQGMSGMGLDAVVVSTILEVERWQFGLSYDVTVSDLSDANNSRGAFELSLIYVHPSKQRFKVVCPNF